MLVNLHIGYEIPTRLIDRYYIGGGKKERLLILEKSPIFGHYTIFNPIYCRAKKKNYP